MVHEQKFGQNMDLFKVQEPMLRENVFPKHLLDFFPIWFGYSGQLSLTSEQYGSAADRFKCLWGISPSPPPPRTHTLPVSFPPHCFREVKQKGFLFILMADEHTCPSVRLKWL